MEAAHEKSPTYRRVKEGQKVRENHKNNAHSLWSKYYKLMDEVGAPSKVRLGSLWMWKGEKVFECRIEVSLTCPPQSSQDLELALSFRKKSHTFMPQVEPEKASLTLYTKISIKILSNFPTSHYYPLLTGGRDLVYLVSSIIDNHLDATHQNIKQSNSANFPVVIRWQG